MCGRFVIARALPVKFPPRKGELKPKRDIIFVLDNAIEILNYRKASVEKNL